MKKKVFFIINPLSGGINKNKIFQDIDEWIDNAQFDYQIAVSKNFKDVNTLSKQAVTQKFDAIVGIGGDGTLHAIGNVIVNTSVALGIIPYGSSNSLGDHFKIPKKIEDALKVINQFKLKTIDTVLINGEETLLGIGAVGFEAYVVTNTFKSVKKRGFWKYYYKAAKALPFYPYHNFSLEVDNKLIKIKGLTITFANISQYGKNGIIAPFAKDDDGFLDIIIAKPFPIYALPKIFYQIYHGTIHHSPYAQMIKCKTATIYDAEIVAHLDGETYLAKDALTLSIAPKSLKIIVP